MRRFVLSMGAFISLLASGPLRADPPTMPLPPDIEALVETLDSPVWEERDSATSKLMNSNTAYADELRRRGRTASSVEAELRLMRIAEELYISRILGPAQACLGIRHESGVGWGSDARLAPGMYGLRIGEVFPNTAADRAGIRPGDLVIGMNGRMAASPDDCINFTAWIGDQTPGTRCEFTILRGVKGRYLQPAIQPGIDRRGFRRLKTRPITFGENDRLPNGAVGLLVTDSSEADPRLGLEPGDVIISLNGSMLPVEGAQALLEKWVETESPNPMDPVLDEENPLGILQVVPGRPRPALVRSPSIQIIRGGRRITVEATLGRWPLFMPSGRSMLRKGATAERVLELRAQFKRWWAEESSGPSESQRRVDPALYWQMER